MAMEAEEVECIRGGYLPAESSRASNLAELIFRPTESEDDSQPIFMGTVGNRTFDVSLRALRHTALYLLEQVKTRGLQRGDTICLLRLPRTSETVIAAAYVALTAGGYRVLFPMYLEPDSFQDWLRISNTRAVLWSLRELRDSIDNESDLALADRLGSMISGLNIPSYCLWDDLKVPELLQGKYAPASSGDANALDLLDAADPESECLVLTTSGSSGGANSWFTAKRPSYYPVLRGSWQACFSLIAWEGELFASFWHIQLGCVHSGMRCGRARASA